VFSLHGETTNTHVTRTFSGLHGENCSERSLPSSDNLCCFNLAPTIRRNMLSLSSGVQLIPVSWSMATKAACSSETSALTYSTMLCVNPVKLFICVLSTSTISDFDNSANHERKIFNHSYRCYRYDLGILVGFYSVCCQLCYSYNRSEVPRSSSPKASRRFLEVTRLFYARLLYVNATRASEVSRETDYRLKAKQQVSNKFSLHVE
jgi:hypothetical protein